SASESHSGSGRRVGCNWPTCSRSASAASASTGTSTRPVATSTCLLADDRRTGPLVGAEDRIRIRLDQVVRPLVLIVFIAFTATAAGAHRPHLPGPRTGRSRGGRLR